MDERIAKKIREAEMLRDVPPSVTLRMGFSLMDFSRRLAEATIRAKH